MMDIQSAALNKLFLLQPLMIPGWISPVLPDGIAAGGIPKSLYDDVPTGLQCLVDPWIERSWTLAAGDRVDLYVNNGATPVAGETINPGGESLRIRLNVPRNVLLDGVNTLHYVVTRPGGNSKNSRELKVLYHLRAPGEPAPNRMKLQIPAIVRDHGVDAEQAEKGVVFSFDYTFRRAYDRIRLTLGTIPVIREVAPGEEGPGQPLTTQTLFTETFKQSGNNPETLIFYSVVDQLGNRNASANTKINVALDRVPSLLPPGVKEASGNNLNPVAARNTLTAVLPADLRSTDLVSVTWAGPAGAPADGTYTTLPRPISETGLEIQLPNTLIAFCLDKQTKLTYIATRGGTSIPSPSFPVNVQSLPLNELRMPMLKEASNNGEGPDLLLHELTAQGLMWFPGFPFIAVDQPVWFRLKGTRSNGDVYDKLLWQPPGAYINQGWFDKGFFEYAAPYADLMDLKDGTPLTMELKVGFGRSTNESEAVSFQVRSYTVKAALDLPAPTVAQAPDGRLDPNRYQDGFTVRVDTSKLLPDDAIELTVAGRPGDGSTIPARQLVGVQAYIDFLIDLRITGANLGRVVTLSYKVLRSGQEIPSKSLLLQIDELLLQSMPRPLIERFDGESLNVAGLLDTTKVLCDKWPFQGFGLPVWLSYVESRVDGSSRTWEQLTGTLHDQNLGLSYTAEVQWLRECRADSKLAIVLKVGLFQGATVAEAVACQGRIYTVRAGLDQLTTFDRFNWNGWMPDRSYPSKIVLEQGEYFVVSLYGAYSGFYKSYSNIDIAGVYEFSVSYKCSKPNNIITNWDDIVVSSELLPVALNWVTYTVKFYLAASSPGFSRRQHLMFGTGWTDYPAGDLKLDNFRLRYISQ